MFHLFPFGVFWKGIFLMIMKNLFSFFIFDKKINNEFRTNSQL